VVRVWTVLFPRFVIVTVAPGTTAPVVSVTMPTIAPLSDCPRAENGNSARKKTANIVETVILLIADLLA
jgi:hypothetical protein